MSFSVRWLSNLKIHTHDGGNFVQFNEFFELLKSEHKPTDKALRKFNLERDLKKNFIYIEGSVWISVQSVLIFIFQHVRDFNICEQIVLNIEKKITTNIPTEQSTLNLYEEISRAEYWILINESGILQSLNFEESSIFSLCDIHKSTYNEVDWKKICLFEKQFMDNHNNDFSRDSYEQLVSKKWNYHHQLCNAYQTSKLIKNDSQATIKTRLKRKLVAEKKSAIKIQSAAIHLPELVESQLSDLFPEDYGMLSCICVDCTKSCSHEPSVHVYLAFDKDKVGHMPDIEICIVSFLENKHSSKCAEIVFFDSDSVKFEDDDGKRRFETRDKYVHGQFANKILYHCIPEQSEYFTGVSISCDECFPPTLPQPLQGETFEIFSEWYLNTPLVCQILLEPFINKRSLAKTENKETFLKSKLTKLYTLYDTLLNISNRNYTGVLQDVNTQDLSLNFQSIKSVFNVTGAFGTTKRLRSAENMIRLNAKDDKCYYDTYLRKFTMSYNSAAGPKTDNVNLRDCVIILMMGNLVRLKHHADPDPGESRSMQMCTLPITLKGLPKDCIEIEHWHRTDCNGQDICSCKKDQHLCKEDIERLILKLSKAEDDVLLQFKKLHVWGYKAVWSIVFENNIHNTQSICYQPPEISLETTINQKPTSAVNLEESLASLQLDDSILESAVCTSKI